MKMQRKIITALSLAAALGASASASATLFTFDPTGTAGASGDVANIALIDQTPGNALAVGGGTAINNFLLGSGSTDFTLLYQANLGTMQFADTSIAVANGTGGNFFNFVAGFGETVVGAGAYPGTATFTFDAANPTNYFTMFANSAIANNLTGVGFGAGTAIMSGHIIAIPTSNFQVTSITPVNLDQAGADNWSGQQSVTGGGSTDLTLVIDSVNGDYFPTLDSGSNIILSFFNTSQLDPYKQIDPSQCVYNGTLCAAGGFHTVGTLGEINGTGENFLMQADGNGSIAVPEPGILALLGLGLLGLFGLSRQRRA